MDWRDDVHPDERKHLVWEEKLEKLRQDEPVVWLVLTGTHAPKIIASKLCWPYKAVMQELRMLKREGMLVDRENVRDGQAMTWHINRGHDELRHLELWRDARIKPGGWSNPRTGQPESDSLFS